MSLSKSLAKLEITAEVRHPDWVLLDEQGDPVLDENRNPVAKEGA